MRSAGFVEEACVIRGEGDVRVAGGQGRDTAVSVRACKVSSVLLAYGEWWG